MLGIHAKLRSLHRALTRFESASELSALNAAPQAEVSVSPLLALAVDAALWAARETDGLVDPTLTGEIEAAGYAESRAGLRAAPLPEALSWAPPRRPAAPSPAGRWQEVSVDRSANVVRRPPGVRIDLGGSGKGLAADLLSSGLEGYSTYALDAGGDIRIGGADGLPRAVSIASALHDDPVLELQVTSGAIATSGISTRLWRTEDGFAHHLIDPATGASAWTGVVQATALGRTALEAETLAKQALLSGHDGGRRALELQGGVLVLDDGTVEPVGEVAAGAQAGDAGALAA